MNKDDIDAHSVILEELGRVPGPKKVAGDTMMVQCPFHSDRSPSCGVYTAVGMEIPLGYFNCFGCGEKGPWNNFAAALGLQTIASWQMVEGEGSNLAKRYKKNEEKLLSLDRKTLRSLMESIGNAPYFPWSHKTEWRGYTGRLIKDCGGQYLIESWKEETHNLMCFFPIAIGKKHYGGIRAYMKKPAGGLSYVNTKGDWVKSYGLFPYNLVAGMIKRYELHYLVFTEGPRDALRLISAGIPTMSILGGHNFNEEKLRLVIRLGVEKIFILSDNDKAGKGMRKLIKNICKESGIEVAALRLPEEYDSKNNLIKMDPDSAPVEILSDMRTYLRKNGGLLPRNTEYKRVSKSKSWSE
jgi:5S rRNA maturation endonuclease (ribonuclease M5)